MLTELDKSAVYKREILQQFKKPKRKVENALEKKHKNVEPAGAKECAESWLVCLTPLANALTSTELDGEMLLTTTE